MAPTRRVHRRHRRHRHRPNRIHWRRRALFGGLITVFVILAAEIGLSAAGVRAAYQPSGLGRWRVQADLVDHRMRGAQESHNFLLNTNADGLRSNLGRAKTEGITRIAVMGDSNVFGWGVDDEQTIGAQIERAFIEMRHPDVSVLNAGMPGYSTLQVGWLFEEVVAHYRPDWTIVFMSMHDFNRTLVSDRIALRGPTGPMTIIRNLLARHSHIYAALRSRIFPLAHRPQLLPHEDDGEPRVARVSDTERSAVLEEMQTAAQAWSGRIAIGMLPFYADLSRPPSEPPGNRVGVDWAIDASRTQQIPLIDIRSCCGPNADDLVFDYDHGHLNALGNARAGTAAAKMMTRWSLHE